MAFIAMLVSTLTLVRPAEAQPLTCSAKDAQCEMTCPAKDAQCLIDKINEANTNGKRNILSLAEGPYTLWGRVNEPYFQSAFNALPTITGFLMIKGLGAGITIIERLCGQDNKATGYPDTGACPRTPDNTEGNVRIFRVGPTGYLWLERVTVRNGRAGYGGGIFNEGSLQVRASTIMRNHVNENGGGIYNRGWVYLQDATVRDNGDFLNGSSRGGGIYIEAGMVEVAYSTINGNRAAFGGGIANGNPEQGVHAGGILTLLNSTISGNYAYKSAGGILNDGRGAEAWLKSVTIAANVVLSGPAGVYGRGNVYFANTIIAGNGVSADKKPWKGVPNDCGGQVVTLGGNLVGDPGLLYPCEIVEWTPWPGHWHAKAPDQIGTKTTALPIKAQDVFVTVPDRDDPHLHALELDDNGGTTCTHALLEGSPAVNAGWKGAPGSHLFACEMYDQRWFERDGSCDIGALEFNKPISPARLGCTAD